MGVRQTSIEAYYSLDSVKKLGHREQEVLDFIDRNPCLTDLEITYKLGYKDPNKVRPRRWSLHDYGFIEDAGLKTDPVTGKTVHCWRITQKGKDQLSFYRRGIKSGS